MAVCDTCGWTGDDADTRNVIGFDPGICPVCLSVHVRPDSKAADGGADAPDTSEGGSA